MKKGDIFSGKHNSTDAYHPIIFWISYNEYEFLGLMITHSSNYSNLDLNDKSYFDKMYDNFSDTYFVQALLIKPIEWAIKPDMKGVLSEKGIAYIESIVKDFSPISWDDYSKS